MIEFDCYDCEQHIVDVVAETAVRCAACIALPGWYMDPHLRAVFGLEPMKCSFLGRLACAIGFHEMRRVPSPPGVMGGLGGPMKCRRLCGKEWPGLANWPRWPERPK